MVTWSEIEKSRNEQWKYVSAQICSFFFFCVALPSLICLSIFTCMTYLFSPISYSMVYFTLLFCVCDCWFMRKRIIICSLLQPFTDWFSFIAFQLIVVFIQPVFRTLIVDQWLSLSITCIILLLLYKERKFISGIYIWCKKLNESIVNKLHRQKYEVHIT